MADWGESGFDDLAPRKQGGDLSGAGDSGFDDLAAPAPQPGVLDRIKNQVSTTVGNVEDTLSNWAGNVEQAAENYGNEVAAAGARAYEARQNGEEINDEDPTEGFEGDNYNAAKEQLYNEAVGKPAGYVAITPFVPAPVRGAAGALAAPTIVSGTVNAYNQNMANDDGTPVISTAKQTLLDPVIEPVKEAATNPAGFAGSIVDNPTNLWGKVFLPGAMAEGAARGGAKLAPRSLKDAAANAKEAALTRAGMPEYNDPFSGVRGRTRKTYQAGEAEAEDNASNYSAGDEGPVYEQDGLNHGYRTENGMQDMTGARTGEDAYRPSEGRAVYQGGDLSRAGESGFDDLAGDNGNRSGGYSGFDDLKTDSTPETTQSEAPVYRGGSETPEETGDMATDVYNRYRMNGLTDAEAAGMTGNVATESDFSTSAVSDDGAYTKGIIQWDGNRYQAFRDWCDQNGRDPSDWRAQVDYSVVELRTTERTALDNMRAKGDALTPEDAAYIIRRDYERPREDVANDAKRQGVARQVYDGQGGKAGENRRTLDDNASGEDLSSQIIESDKKSDADMNFIREPSKSDISDSIGDNTMRGDIFRKDDAKAIDDFHNRDESEKAQAARDSTNELADGIEAKDGNRISFKFEDDNRRAADTMTDEAMRGREGMTANDRRNYAAGVVKDTVKNPDIIYKKDGSTFYTSFRKGENGQPSRAVTVEMRADGSSRLTTAEMGENASSPTPERALANRIDGAEVTYTSDAMRASVPRAEDAAMNAQNVNRLTDAPQSVYTMNPSDNIQAEVSGNQHARTIQRMSNDVNYGASDESHTVTRQEILDTINREFGATIRKGRVDARARGQYDPRQNVIRTREDGTPRVITHELGHYLDNQHHFSSNPEFGEEFERVIHDRFGNAYDSLGPEGIRSEGFAEFLHDYAADKKMAKRNFPTFYDYFEKTISKDPKMVQALDRLGTVVRAWNNQGSVARVKGSISFSDSMGFQGLRRALQNGDFGEAGKKAFNKIYTQVMDELNPLREVVEEAEARTGQKLALSENPFLQAWVARGWAGKAMTLLQHGDPDAGVKSLKEIYQMVGKDKMKDFSALLVALRENDIIRWNEKVTRTHEGEPIQTTLDPVDVGITIRKLAKDEKLMEAAKELKKYQDNLLDRLVSEGILTMKQVADMRAKYPHYVPFQRVVDKLHGGYGTGGGFVDVASPIKKMKGSTRDIIDPLESIIRNTFVITQTIERNKVGRAFVNLSRHDGMGDLVEAVNGTPKATDSTFSVWIGGKKHTFATSPEILDALKMTDKDGADMFVKIMSKPASWVRAGATLSPEFILRNPVRDMISAFMYSRHGFIPVVDTARGLALYLKKGKEYWDYMNSGAAEASMVSLDRDYLHGQMRDLLKNPSVLAQCAKNPIEVLQAFSEATEMATRLAEFDLAKKGYTGIMNRLFGSERKPVSDEIAGIQSRDVTLDFGRHGTKTTSLNKTVAFFNAALQGTDKMVREWKEHPGNMALKTTIGITLPSVILWYLNKDDPRYQELPQWQKDIFWVIPGKDTLYKIPKPFELGILFGTAPERMLQYMYDKEKGRKGPGFKGLGESIFDNMLPSFWPTGLLPIAEWMSNYSFFMGRNIVPESQKNLPDKEQYGPYTSWTARKAGELFDLSPRKIDNTIQGLSGNFGRLINTGIDAATGLSDTRPSLRGSEMPGVRGFTATPYASSDSEQRLRDEYMDQLKLYNEFKLTHKKPEGFSMAQYQKYKTAMDGLSRVYKAEKVIRDSTKLNSEEKREKLDKLKLTKVNISRRAFGDSRVHNEEGT